MASHFTLLPKVKAKCFTMSERIPQNLSPGCTASCISKLFLFEKKKNAGPWWLMLVILATQEAEIRRITILRQFGQIVTRDPISKSSSQK
jgi:hypothetical protein